MANNGDMVLGNPAGAAGLSWNQGAGTLTIKGNITLIGGLDAAQISTGILNVARFGDGTIATIKLLAGAVTSYGATTNAASVAVAYLGAGTAVLSYSFYTTGGPLTITAGCRVNPYSTSGILYSGAIARGGTTSAYFLAAANAQTYPTTTLPVPYNSSGLSLTYSEQLGAGTYTWYLMVDANLNNGTAQNRYITVTEHKR